MKEKLTICILEIGKIVLNIIYVFLKLLPINENKVTLLSRQANTPSIDYELLTNELISRNKKTVVLCKKIESGILKKISYCIYILKCMYHIATSKACIVDGYFIPISILKHKKKLKIIQIWHALGAIKKFGYDVINRKEGSNYKIARIMKMHKNYDYVTSASEITKKIYEKSFGIPEERIVKIGMPRIDYILDEKDFKQEYIKDYPQAKGKKIILYVPTFRKEKASNFQEIIKCIDDANYNLIIRLHPIEQTRVDAKYTVNDKYLTIDLIKIADYIITDYSAVAFEAALLDKPIFFYLYDKKEYEVNRGLNINIDKELPSFTFYNFENIVNAINNIEYNINEIIKFKEKYIETRDKNNTKRICDLIENRLGAELHDKEESKSTINGIF